MLKVHQILVSAITLAASAAALSGCGQKGPLVLPTTTAKLPANSTPSSSSSAAGLPAPVASTTR